jgi:hypothetical protein
METLQADGLTTFIILFISAIAILSYLGKKYQNNDEEDCDDDDCHFI